MERTVTGPWDVTVAVATFGSEKWADLARRRAIPSAEALRVPVVHCHDLTLHDARNGALAMVETEFVCFLDADDELEAEFFTEIFKATADLRAPAVRYVRNGRLNTSAMPRVAGHLHACEPACLEYGNWLVIGTVVRADLIRRVGGWRDYAVYEDYDLWVRCWQAGATIESVPAAIYRAHVRPDSRNRAPSQSIKHSTHQQIALANGLPVPA